VTAFWVIGIGVNVVVMAAVVYWAVKNWRRGDVRASPRRPEDEE
jgi:hypothetical protein